MAGLSTWGQSFEGAASRSWRGDSELDSPKSGSLPSLNGVARVHGRAIRRRCQLLMMSMRASMGAIRRRAFFVCRPSLLEATAFSH
jgi:hypothetical protein